MGRRYRVQFFELQLDQPPELQLYNREIIAAWLALSDELGDIALTGPIAAYLSGHRCLAPAREPEIP
jgi:8-oxo-dGTP diphosphatase